MAYRLREDRCEGLYRLQVNSDKLRIVSWTHGFEDYDLADSRPLEVSWSVPPGPSGPVRLRADALRPETYYRMDTRRPGSEGRWTWRTPLLGRLGLGRPDLGFVGWTATGLSACSDEALFLPVGVRQDGAAEGRGYRVALVPGERLSELFWSVAPADTEWSVQPPPSEETPVGYGYYPAGRPTIFEVPGPRGEGIYVLRIRAQLRSGGRASRDLCFYHPGPSGEGGPDPAAAEAGSSP